MLTRKLQLKKERMLRTRKVPRLVQLGRRRKRVWRRKKTYTTGLKRMERKGNYFSL